jgi:uncharacterized protein Yka (UPF0111/DUF47 family)
MIISFRVPKKDYIQLERIARTLAENGKIRNESVNTLCKAFMYVKANEFKQIELMQEEIDAREKEARKNV